MRRRAELADGNADRYNHLRVNFMVNMQLESYALKHRRNLEREMARSDLREI